MNRPENSRRTSPSRTVLDFRDNILLPALFGDHDRHLVRIEQALDVALAPRGNRVAITGRRPGRDIAAAVLEEMYAQLQRGEELTDGAIDGILRMKQAEHDNESAKQNGVSPQALVKTGKRAIAPRSPRQEQYVRSMRENELVFALGPAGTGKTYLGVAVAVSMLLDGRIERIILSRPAVEAGERLGFLPGDMREKIDPYLRPLYDALYDMLPGEQVTRRLASGEIEIAPLAFMRGRTLSNAFVILDEAQNTTPVQMKMFLTRLGEHSRMVVTGDPSQVDLPPGVRSGLAQALQVLGGVEGIGRIDFTAADVVRHPLVTRIVRAYDSFRADRNEEKPDDNGNAAT